jgi:hypothetical protein
MLCVPASAGVQSGVRCCCQTRFRAGINAMACDCLSDGILLPLAVCGTVAASLFYQTGGGWCDAAGCVIAATCIDMCALQ